MQEYEIPEGRILHRRGNYRRSVIEFIPEDFDGAYSVLMDSIESDERIQLIVGQSSPVVARLARVSVDAGGSGCFEIEVVPSPLPDRHNLINRLRMTQADNEQARLIRLQLAQDRRKRIEAGIRALGICGRLRGDCRAVWARRTLGALNRARRVEA